MENTISSIQLHENVKKELEKHRENPRESYQDIILKLMQAVDKQKREHVKLMIEGAKETAEESLKITKEFEKIEEDFDWEWKDN
jgi:type II secretory pathway predicted ATPase ExeA